jgi:hypothetical protein
MSAHYAVWKGGRGLVSFETHRKERMAILVEVQKNIANFHILQAGIDLQRKLATEQVL